MLLNDYGVWPQQDTFFSDAQELMRRIEGKCYIIQTRKAPIEASSTLNFAFLKDIQKAPDYSSGRLNKTLLHLHMPDISIVSE